MNNEEKIIILRKNNFFTKSSPELHYQVFLNNFVKFFGINKDNFIKLNFIKQSIGSSEPVQISYSLLEKMDNDIFINKEETLKKFDDFIMYDLDDEELKGYKYVFVYITEY